MATPAPQPGSMFGPYRVDAVIAQGRRSLVLLATDQRLGRQVALEVVVDDRAGSPGFVDRFQREAATLAGLESPHVVQVLDHGVQDGTAYVASQYAAGGDLRALLAQRGPMPLPLAAQAMSQVAEALRDAHRAGVVHGDLTPGDVLLRDDRLDRIHVLVSGLGRAPVEADAPTEPASAPGAWNYLAPERVQGGPPTESADVYAVGCLLLEAVTGRPPYPGTDVEVAGAHVNAPVPQLPGTDEATQRLNAILARCLAKDPAERYPSAGELRDELRSFAGILSGPSQPPAPPTPAAADLPTMAPGSMPPPPPNPPQGPPPAGPPTPQYQSLSVPQAPPYAGQSATRKNRTPLLIGAAVVVALLLVVGIVVAVVAGGDDEPEAGPTDGPTSGTTSDPTDPTDSTDPTDPTTSEPTDPETSGSTDPGPVEPVLDGAITGDIDGDGFGDFAVQSFDGLLLFPSDGTSGFGDVDTRKNRAGLSGMVGDVDDDGVLDIVRIQNEPPQFAAAVSIKGSAVSPIATPDSPYLISPLDVKFSLGDVDGDGNLDLVAVTPFNETRVQVAVALGNGDGTFQGTTVWFDGELEDSEGNLVLADVDGDGDADMLFNYSQPDSATPLVDLFVSDGGAFALEGEPFALDNGGFASDSLRAGDFDGDGVDEVMSFASYGPALWLLSYENGSWVQTPWYDNSDTLDPPSMSGWMVSDVNGDGFDDVVTSGADDNLDPLISGVFLSDGRALTADLSWGRPLPENVGVVTTLQLSTGS